MNCFPEEWNQDPFFKEQIFTYLGNKRKLLPLIYEAIIQSGIHPEETTFVDLFTGSGVVSRLAKKMKFHTLISNDWEKYSFVTQNLYLKEDPLSIQELFKNWGGIQNVIDKLNHISTEEYKNFYISRYYAPQDRNNFDTRTERLFYTPENAQKIDAIRETIESWYPTSKILSPIEEREKHVLIALLIYKCSVHTNTSGVFKAYYKDFGGYGNHSLKRIVTPLHLDFPILSLGTKNIFIYEEDALALLNKINISTPKTLVYLDPPYNVHQYGSNYHLLNTVTQWDKIDMDYSYTQEGQLKEKSGIRKDWVKKKSTFCSLSPAIKSFQTLISSLSADIILISYSLDGIIPLESMLDILIHKGKTVICMNPYTTYRGGKKGSQRKNINLEFVFIVYTNLIGNPEDKNELLNTLSLKKFFQNLEGIYPQKKLKLFFSKKKKLFHWKKNPHIYLQISDLGEYSALIGIESLSPQEFIELKSDLYQAQCQDKQEELVELFLYYKKEYMYIYRKEILKKIFIRLKHLAYPKYKKEFLHFSTQLQKLISSLDNEKYHFFIGKFQSLQHIFQKRQNRYENH